MSNQQGKSSNNGRSSGGRPNGKPGGRSSNAKGAAKRSGSKAKRANNGAANGRSSNPNDDRQSNRRRKAARKKRVDPKVFWGDPEKLPVDRPDGALITTSPSAVVQSLGRAPLAGQQNAADLYFAAVYERSVNLAAALAAAGGLVEPDDIT